MTDRRSIELEAAGNAIVEGATKDGRFTARAIRMTYAEAKGLLVLEGDGRSDATLYRQQRLGAAPGEVSAQRILYWPETRQLKLEGARSLVQ